MMVPPSSVNVANSAIRSGSDSPPRSRANDAAMAVVADQEESGGQDHDSQRLSGPVVTAAVVTARCVFSRIVGARRYDPDRMVSDRHARPPVRLRYC